MKMNAAFIVAVAMFSTVTFAQDTRTAELADSNRKLNITYGALMRQLSPQDQVGLRAAQRAWIAFRDLDCKVGWADVRDCLGTRTDEREQQLRASVYWNRNGRQIELAEPE